MVWLRGTSFPDAVGRAAPWPLRRSWSGVSTIESFPHLTLRAEVRSRPPSLDRGPRPGPHVHDQLCERLGPVISSGVRLSVGASAVVLRKRQSSITQAIVAQVVREEWRLIAPYEVSRRFRDWPSLASASLCDSDRPRIGRVRQPQHASAPSFDISRRSFVGREHGDIFSHGPASRRPPLAGSSSLCREKRLPRG